MNGTLTLLNWIRGLSVEERASLLNWTEQTNLECMSESLYQILVAIKLVAAEGHAKEQGL